MSNFKLLIDGEMVDGDATLDVINPATEEVFAKCARASRKQLDQAVDAATAALPAWGSSSIADRQKVLIAIADAIKAETAELARLLVQEQGKPLQDATNEIFAAQAFFRYFAGMNLETKILQDDDAARIEVRRKPLGVVGCIIPWNFPIVLMAFKVPAALLAGNTLIVKPAPTTPLTTISAVK